jgi:hypothetical protein
MRPGHPWHNDDLGDGVQRTHDREVAALGRLSVRITADAHAAGDRSTTERLEPPRVTLFIDLDAEHDLEDLTAAQARNLARFMSEALNAAAAQVDAMDLRQR